VDLDELGRFNGEVDIGAYEHWGHPTPVAVHSLKQHGVLGALGIELPLDGRLTTQGESRLGGPTEITLVFDKVVVAEDGTPDESEVALSAGALEAVTIEGSTIAVHVSGVPDASCLEITLTGVVDLDNRPVLGGRVRLASLAGDTNGDGLTNLVDMSQVKNMNGATVPEGNVRFDVNTDGSINLIDMGAVGSLNGSWGGCQ
jgi:hypothetical protein